MTSVLKSRAFAFTAILAAALAVAIGVGVAQAADPKLDLADAALEKTAALLEASQGPTWDEKANKDFEKAVQKAIDDVADARAQIVEAKAASDGASLP